MTIPGDIISALLASGEIPDPFYDRNELSLQWIGREDWLLEREFEAPQNFQKRERMLLEFDCIDTIAEIRVNGEFLGASQNMFRAYRADIKKLLHPGLNRISVLIRSPEAAAKKAAASRWRFENLVQEGEGALLVGPAFAGSSLDEAEGVQAGMPLLLAVARALAVLAAEGGLPRGLVSSGVLVSEDYSDAGGGAVLILPPVAVAKALSVCGAAARAGAVARLSSPRAKGPEADASFFLAQAAYRYATGSSAFEREASEPGSVAGASRYSTAASLAAPRLIPELSALVDAALEDPNRVSLGSWIGTLETAAAKGWERDLSGDEAVEISRRRAAVEAESRARRKRSDFFRRRGGILIAAVVVAVGAALVAGDMLRAQRDKPDYSKFPAPELVRQYYAALDSLDLDSLEACVEGKAVKGDRDYVMNMTVIVKTRFAYEGRSPIKPAGDWVVAGKPALAETDLLYGIVGLSIAEEAGGLNEAKRFRATYSFWSLERKDDPSGDLGKAVSLPLEEKRVDELALARGERGWKIVGLERKVLP
jgi:hypothetical protein